MDKRTKICLGCKRKFRKRGCDSWNYWKRKKYCSIKCSNTLLIKGHIPWNKGKPGKAGKDSPSYKGGRNISKNGYIRILIPGTGEYQLEHRKVMEELLGRKLQTREHIHHINGIKTDNRIKNLKLMNIKDHNKMHTTNRWESGGF